MKENSEKKRQTKGPKEYEPLIEDCAPVRKDLNEVSEQRLKKDPQDYEALFALAYLEPFVRRRLQKLERVLEINPNHLRTLYTKARDLSLLSSLNGTARSERIRVLELSMKAYKQAMRLWPENTCLVTEYDEVVAKYKRVRRVTEG
jgi:hypothetical protein